jgi:Rod binding domain-containing protein
MGIPLSPSAALLAATPSSGTLSKKTTSLETPTFQEALATASTESAKVDEAAKQFEALVVGQVLKVSRESSDGGWLGSGEDQGGEMAVELGEQAFAQAIAARGGFGIAKLVKANLERGQPTVASSGSTTLRQPPTSNESTR